MLAYRCSSYNICRGGRGRRFAYCGSFYSYDVFKIHVLRFDVGN